ncbi:hypothetical protein NQ028_01025 [Corynebacterium phoceense]|uniref:hypothetical protein n=1 Tax=Corynebacterium phoceense TaxID=1686286 RepID=UPI00211BBC4E|nr:hypothetical protein [Corynebacterium phoceense]MCQ9339728.1 hypothetical protein [Corynebacterium phoceense]
MTQIITPTFWMNRTVDEAAAALDYYLETFPDSRVVTRSFAQPGRVPRSSPRLPMPPKRPRRGTSASAPTQRAASMAGWSTPSA